MALFDVNDLNPVEKMIINRVKKTMSENGVKSVLMYEDEAGQVQFEVYHEPVKVMTLTQMKQLVSEIESKSENFLSNGNSNTDTDTDATTGESSGQ